MKLPKQEYTAEFKELADRLVKSSQAVCSMAKELGLAEQALLNRVKYLGSGKLNGLGVKKVTSEEMGIFRLIAEDILYQRHVEILINATVYFAKDEL